MGRLRVRLACLPQSTKKGEQPVEECLAVLNKKWMKGIKGVQCATWALAQVLAQIGENGSICLFNQAVGLGEESIGGLASDIQSLADFSRWGMNKLLALVTKQNFHGAKAVDPVVENAFGSRLCHFVC